MRRSDIYIRGRDRNSSDLRGRDPRQLFEAVKADRIRFYHEIVARNPSQRIWLQGWLNRVNSQNFKS